jgi:hypothetical protein
MVKPIDVQDNLSKTSRAERVNQIQKSAPDIDQRQAAHLAKEEQVQKQREPQKPERTDEALIHRDREQKQDSQGREKEKKDKKNKKRNDKGLDVTA